MSIVETLVYFDVRGLGFAYWLWRKAGTPQDYVRLAGWGYGGGSGSGPTINFDQAQREITRYGAGTIKGVAQGLKYKHGWNGEDLLRHAERELHFVGAERLRDLLGVVRGLG